MAKGNMRITKMAVLALAAIALVAAIAGNMLLSKSGGQATQHESYTSSAFPKATIASSTSSSYTTTIPSSYGNGSGNYANQSVQSFGHQQGSYNPGPQCGNTTRILSTSPVSLNQIEDIVPLGHFAEPGHIAPADHMYILPFLSPSNPNSTPVYAPANITITEIDLFVNNEGSAPSNAYKITFWACNKVEGFLNQIVSLNSSIFPSNLAWDKQQSSYVGYSTPDYEYTKYTSIKVRAGEIIGQGLGTGNGLEFTLDDFRTQNSTTANPLRWSANPVLHAVCPLDYFPSNISTALYSKIGAFNGSLLYSSNQRCGEVFQDAPGTAQGLWIAKTQNTTINESVYSAQDYLLELGHSNYNYSIQEFVLGNYAQRQLGLGNFVFGYSFAAQQSGNVNLNFSKVAPNSTYCYQITNQYNQGLQGGFALLIQLINSTTVRIGQLPGSASCGSGPWHFSAYTDFMR